MTIEQIEQKLNKLEEAFIQSQRNQVDKTSKLDNTDNKVNTTSENATEGITTNSANIDYIAMMSDIEIPTEEEE